MAKLNYSKYKKKTYKRRAPTTYTSKRVKSAPKTKSNLVSLIKRIQLNQSETKYKSRDLTYGIMKHGSINILPIYDKDAILGAVSIFPQQGINDASRIGDRIVCQKIKLRLQLDVPWDRRNMKVKVFFIEYNSDQGSPNTYNQLFHEITGNPLLDPIQFKRWGKSIRYLGTYYPMTERTPFFTYPGAEGAPGANTTASNTGTVIINKDIMFKRKVCFTGDTAMTPSNTKENGHLLIIPYATANTSGNDNVVLSADGVATLYYKDL